MSGKWGIKVPFLDGDFLWVTVGDSKFQLQPLLFETEEAAQKHASEVWGDSSKVEIYLGE